MPHDKNQRVLKEGDEVLVRCKVTRLDGHPDYANATLETVEPMYPGKDKSSITINTRQCEKADNEDHEELEGPGVGC